MQKLLFCATLGTLSDGNFKPLAVRSEISNKSIELVGDWRNGSRPRFRRLCYYGGEYVFYRGHVDNGTLTNKFALFSWDSMKFEKKWGKIMNEMADGDKRHA